MREQESDGPGGPAEGRGYRRGALGVAGQRVGRRTRSSEGDACGQLGQGGWCVGADDDERGSEPGRQMQDQGHARDRRAGHHDQLEEPAGGRHRRSRDDVADRADQRQPGEQNHEARRDRDGRLELQAQLGAEPVEHQRRRGRDGATHPVLEEEGQTLPVQAPVHAVDGHRTQRTDQTGQPTGAKRARRRERERAPCERGDPALVGVRCGDDRVEFVAGIGRGHRARADAGDQPVDGRQPAEVDGPGLHDVQRARCRQRRAAVDGDVDRRVNDVDLAAVDAVGGRDGGDLVHRRGGGHAGRHQDGPDVAREIEDLADACGVGLVAGRVDVQRRLRNARHRVGRRVGLPDDPAQNPALCSPAPQARATTGQLHGTTLPPLLVRCVGSSSTAAQEVRTKSHFTHGGSVDRTGCGVRVDTRPTPAGRRYQYCSHPIVAKPVNDRR